MSQHLAVPGHSLDVCDMFRTQHNDSIETLNGNMRDIDRLHELSQQLDYCWAADSVDERRKRLSFVLQESRRSNGFGGHSIVKKGNDKLPKHWLIMSIGAASDCPNLLTGRCQAGAACYALQDENTYLSDKQPDVLDKARRAEIVFRSVSAADIAHAIGRITERANTDFRQLRINESGDVWHRADVQKFEDIAEILAECYDIDSFIYSASSHIEWPDLEYITVNVSNDDMPEHVTDNRFKVVQNAPEDGFVCEDDCTECAACVSSGGDDIIYVEQH